MEPLLVFPTRRRRSSPRRSTSAGYPWKAVADEPAPPQHEPDDGWAGAHRVRRRRPRGRVRPVPGARASATSPLEPCCCSSSGAQLGELELREDLFDDFCLSPFHPRELEARLRAPVLAHRPGHPARARRVRRRWCSTSRPTRPPSPAGRSTSPTWSTSCSSSSPPTRARCSPARRCCQRVWGYEYYGGARTVDVHVRRLRAKLGEEHANLIQTVRSVGYRFGQSRFGGPSLDRGRPRSRSRSAGVLGCRARFAAWSSLAETSRTARSRSRRRTSPRRAPPAPSRRRTRSLRPCSDRARSASRSGCCAAAGARGGPDLGAHALVGGDRVPRCRGNGGEHRVGRARDSGRPGSSTIVTSIGGVRAGRIIAERADREVEHVAGVRVDREAFGAHPPERHVRGADAIGAQHHLVERIPRGDAHLDPLDRRRRRSTRRRAPAIAPSNMPASRVEQHRRDALVTHQRGAIDTGFVRTRLRRARASSATPDARAARRAGRHRRGVPAARLDADTRVRQRRRGGHVAADDRAVDAHHSPSRHTALAAIGGRFGPSRTVSSREYTTAHRAPELVGEPRGRRRARATPTLPPNAPPFASGVAGSPPGSHHDASGSRYAGSTQLVASRTPPSGSGGNGKRRRARRRSCAGPAPCPPRPRLGQRLAHDPLRRASIAPASGPTRRERHRDQRVARRGVVGEAAAPAAARRHRPAGRRRPRARPARGGVEVATRRAGTASSPRTLDRLVDRLPSGAAAEVRRERAVDVGAAVACRERSAPRPAPGSPACRTRTATAPVATNASASRSRAVGSSPSSVVTDAAGDPLDRGDARDPRLAVDEHGAAAALALRRAAVLHRHDPEPLAQHVEERFARFALDVDGCAVARERDPMTSCVHEPAG